ncbi:MULTISPECIES: amino acid kinase family protein [Lactobacillus]|uniref:amino acid kinase family protein n=1 Tax=Lactobacillus TaxID=1578 RepID=UPI000B5DA59C|nr:MULTISPECIES: peptide transporter [Lactobacillus]PEG82519.1 peptide transporter [Lactobacillus sp. UMNPBX16]PEG99553.1 peptide transporter [Lactobacillus sp. UMNPBX8]
MKYLQNVFQGRSFLDCKDYTPAEISYLIDFASHLKELKKEHIPHEYLKGKNIALLFEKASTRTQSAFVVACNDLGAHPEYLGASEIHLGKKESVKDTAKVLGSMLGVNVHIVTPKPLFTHPDVQKIAQNFAQDSGSKNLITDDIAQGVKGANVVYTDVWVSMGENDWSERIKLLKPYTVTMKMMQMTGTPDDQLIFMHCLPAFHDRTTQVGEEIYEKYGLNEMEVTDEVFNSKYAWQFTEAENRLHSIKAVMAATLGNLFIPIACGGGGIPVIVKDGHLRGVAGVIDKDFSAAKMAEDINADELVILTTVDHAFLNYGKENQQAIGKIKVEQLKQYLAAGYFAAGSMKPKIEAAIEFVEKTGNLAIITSLSNANKLADGVGTIVYN